ncbi:DUF4185 domain-containing protein [Candidatus Woesearchaeota archaeon]|nr:DUF4185 domain-containing protein [Candidatus Woesearchaeota archaeon]
MQSDGIIIPTFLQFGKNYAGARDAYVYSYAINLKNPSSLEVQIPGEIILMRVPQASIMNRASYEFFSGLDSSGNPTWTTNLAARKPVFADSKGVGWTASASFNSGLGRYFLITEHDGSFNGDIGIFEAQNPWGPWSTIYYTSAFGSPTIPANTFFWNFANKWLSTDGKDFTLVFTGVGESDSWNTVRGNFLFTN